MASRTPDLSIVIPTYNERENVEQLLSDITSEFRTHKIRGEIVFVDDNSPDKTGKLLEILAKGRRDVKVVHRKGKLGLSSAVILGFEEASSGTLAVMDADLAHPADKIGDMFNTLNKENADMVIGSRYVEGGRIHGWNAYRKIMSWGATILAFPFTSVKDPMTGFFMMRRDCIEDVELDPKGFKILLDILVRCRPDKVIEVPITFTNRTRGKSKIGAHEIFRYLQNLASYTLQR
jgi:dolichol-phosphate mannosyltransferase